MTGRLLLFAGQIYYPYGGVSDLKGSADNNWDLKELLDKLCNTEEYFLEPDWAHIVRKSDMQILERYTCGTWRPADVELDELNPRTSTFT